MEITYERGARLMLLNLALGLGTFIQVLDTSIANVAVPYIAGNLAVSSDQGTWVITSFAVSNAIVLPLTGWLSDYFGRVRLFTVSLILFALMSFLCGFAWSLPSLVMFRILQGGVAGALIPLSQSLIVACNPPDKRGAALGFWAMIVVVAPIAGPILGGYLTEVYSWPWIFYINVPLGIFSATVVWMMLRTHETEIVRVPIDWWGLFLLTVGVGSLQIMLDKGRDLDWYESNVIIGLTIAGIISLLYFGIWTYFQKNPIIDFSFFKDCNFAIGTFCVTVGYLLFFGSTVTIPLWLQTSQGYTAYWAGIAVAPVGVIPVIFALVVGWYMTRVDVRIMVFASFALMGLASFYQANFISQVSITDVMLARLSLGAGLVLFFLPLVHMSLGSIPKERYASAAGLFNFLRILVGSGFGTSLAVEMWTRLEVFHHARLSELATVYNSQTTQFYEKMSHYSSDFIPSIVNNVLDQTIAQEAYVLSTNDMSWLTGWIFVVLAPLPFFCKRMKNEQEEAPPLQSHETAILQHNHKKLVLKKNLDS